MLAQSFLVSCLAALFPFSQPAGNRPAGELLPERFAEIVLSVEGMT